VYDDEMWIADLESWTRDTVSSGVPTLGICFGHQLMARALGGVVERADNGWGVGVHEMRVVETRPWMDPNRGFLRLVMSHQDQVVGLPPGSRVLGSSDHCPNFLVEFTPTAVGLQGHPEFTAALAAVLYEDKRKRIGSLADEAIGSLSTPTDTARVAQWAQNLMG